MKKARASAPLYPIRAASRLTGVAIDTLRAWERRYGAVTPTRDERGRLYTEADISRLRLLNRAVSAGHSVGRIAAMSDAQLRRLTAVETETAAAGDGRRTALDTSAFRAALQKLDTAAMDQEFARLAAVLPAVELVQQVLMPTLRDVGDDWNARRGGIAHEHLLSSNIRHLLSSFLRLYARRHGAFRLVFATPSGDRHEVGILAAAMLAASQGITVSYVGPDLPAVEIIEAVKSADANVLVLGLTLKDGGPPLKRELGNIVRDLPSRVELWVGGPGIDRHAALIGPRGLLLADFEAYTLQLARLADVDGAR